MSEIIIVTGTPGAGKTSVLANFSKKHEVINIGTEMLNVARKLMGIEDRDKIRYLKAEAIAEIREAAIREINNRKGRVILDTHASVKTGNRYVPGFSTSEISALKGLKGIIYIDAEPKEILERRKNDKTRVREEETEEEIMKHRMVNLAFVATYAAQANAPIYIIENKADKLSDTKREAGRIINEIFEE